jgi:uncharacterized protein YbbK (DUF523 family)
MTKRQLSRRTLGPSGPKSDRRVLVSACLLGFHCRFDGSQGLKRDLLEKLRGSLIIPICPEQLGGLSTPRNPSEIVGGNGFDVLQGRAKVIDSVGYDLTQNFLRGAEETLKIAKIDRIQMAYLKERSPSCGTTQIVRRKKKNAGSGVTAALLMKEGIEVIGVC